MSEKSERDPVERDHISTPDGPAVEVDTVIEDGAEAEVADRGPDTEVDPEPGLEADVEPDEASDEETVAPPSRSRRPSKDRTAQLEREGEVAADFLERLLDIADLDGDIDVDIDGDRASVAIIDSEEGRVPRRLVGQDGRVLEALQELTRMAVQAATGERSRLMLDVADHRAQRREAVLSVTRRAIEEVRSSGEPTPLEPMSAFERKVAHDEVLAAGLISESEGAEPNRHVVVLPA